MKGDFTRNTFDPDKHFLRVLIQQGRVQLDSDWNEQASILLHYLQTLTADLIGPYAGPAGEHWGFEIKDGNGGDFIIGKGRYYVNGILCENEQEIQYLSQPDYPVSEEDALENNNNYIVYLDVWERHISFVVDDEIREKALNGADTATRSKIIWQVKVSPLIEDQYAYCQQGRMELNHRVLAISEICMSAWARQGQPSTQPCLTEPEAQYRGSENQLYRVEIHNNNFEIDEDGKLRILTSSPTFKFSRENGSVIFPIKSLSFPTSDTALVELEHLGCDDRLGLAVCDWVEFIDDRIDLYNKAIPLFQVETIDTVNRKVNLSRKETTEVDFDENKHPFLRRWDQKKSNKINGDGVIEIKNDNEPFKLEDGIEVRFSIPTGSFVRRGDYWLIPARTVTGDVEWPKLTDDNGKVIKDANNKPIPKELPPMGTLHHYAPLAIIKADGNTFDCRCSFNPQSDSCTYFYSGRLGIGTDLLCPPEDNQ